MAYCNFTGVFADLEEQDLDYSSKLAENNKGKNFSLKLVQS